MRHIPNFLTSLNLASGFIAVIFALKGEPVTASWLILAAMIFDFLDGFAARLLKAYSEIGKELDSLADVVSFGVAPAMILYGFLVHSLKVPLQNASAMATSIRELLIYIPVIMPVCAALRLAKFNLDSSQTTSFKGLPTPANAIAVITIVFASSFSSTPVIISFAGSTPAIIIYTILLSVLMVTNIPLLSNKMTSLKFKGNEARYILIGLVVIFFAVCGFASTPLIIPFYILASLIDRLFFNKARP